MISKIFRVLFSFKKKIFSRYSALSNFSGCLFFGHGCKASEETPVSKHEAFCICISQRSKKNAKLRRTTVICMWVVVCCSLSKRALLEYGNTLVHFTI